MDTLRPLTAPLAAALDNPAISWKPLILAFALGSHALESYLQYRQYLVLHRRTIPFQLRHEIEQATFDKSQAYGRSKYWFTLVSGLWSQAKNIAVITLDVYPRLWAITGLWIARYAPWGLTGEIPHSLLFATTYALAETALGLPFAYYHTFHLEARYNFNKSTPQLWIADALKSFALSMALGLPIGAAFLGIVGWAGDTFFLYLWLFSLFVQLAGITLYPLLIIPLFNTLTPLEPGELKTRVEALAGKLKFPLAELRVIDGSKRSAHSNAYFTGLPWKKTIVLYDTLLAQSSVPEVEAILAHELGHWHMGHTTSLLGISAGHLLFVFGLFGVFVHNASLYQAFGFVRERPTIIGFILFNEVLSPTDAVVKLGMNLWTRRMEFQADAFSKQLGYSRELAASLIKLQVQNLSSMDADWLYSTYNYSHPILTERLKAIGWTSEHRVSAEKKADGDETVGGEANGHKEL
ncbi:zinc metalloprotease [Teratosphaeriaceae sp. CCFEE 6253]|nr:zinc metalloprotease [Teratosphaeriaceae sp. CCFEE 6253]